MNVLIVIFLAVICLILTVIASKLPRKEEPKRLCSEETEGQMIKTRELENNLKELVGQMREKSRERDAELAAYAAKKRKQQPLANPIVCPVPEDRVHQTNSKAEKILIPENLSEEERAVLKDFFNL